MELLHETGHHHQIVSVKQKTQSETLEEFRIAFFWSY